MNRSIVKPEDIVVPDGMIEATRHIEVNGPLDGYLKYILAVALAWQTNNHQSSIEPLLGDGYSANLFGSLAEDIEKARTEFSQLAVVADRYWNERNKLASELGRTGFDSAEITEICSGRWYANAHKGAENVGK